MTKIQEQNIRFFIQLYMMESKDYNCADRDAHNLDYVIKLIEEVKEKAFREGIDCGESPDCN